MADSEFHWRMAESDDDAKAIAPMLLLDMHKEVGRGTLNPNKTFRAIYEAVTDGRAAMIFKGNTLVGSVGLAETDFWYSDDLFLVEQWAYIAQSFRGAASMRCMFEACRHITLAKDYGTCVMIVFNEARAKARSEIAHIGEQFAFSPAGEVIEIEA